MLVTPLTCCAVEKNEAVSVQQTSPQLTLIGHPFSPMGTGRALRVTFAACRSVGIEARIRDVWGFYAPEPGQASEIVPFVDTSYSAVNAFHLNGDEVEPALKQIGPLPSVSECEPVRHSTMMAFVAVTVVGAS
jgi:hypothetical protein